MGAGQGGCGGVAPKMRGRPSSFVWVRCTPHGDPSWFTALLYTVTGSPTVFNLRRSQEKVTRLKESFVTIHVITFTVSQCKDRKATQMTPSVEPYF